MHSSPVTRRLLAAVSLAALPLTLSATQPPPVTKPKELSPVVVTATRTAQSPFDVAASIDVVALPPSGNLNVNPSELLVGIPGVLARDRQNYAQDEQISIRGFGARATFGIRGIRMYTDGIPATMPDGQGQVSNFNLDSADRIEVLRGPFSALYGNAAGGVIQLFTADGTAPPQIRVGFAGGSDGLLRAETNARGMTGPLDYNIDFTHFQTNGYRDHSRAKRESGNAKLGWQLGTHRKLTLVVNTLNLPEALDPQGLTPEQYQQNPRQGSTPSGPYNTRKTVSQQQTGLIYEDQLTDHGTLRLMGYYGERRVEQFLSIPTFVQASPQSSGGVVDLHNAYGGADARWTWAGSLAGQPLQLALGLNYDNQHQHRLGYNNFVGSQLGVVGALRRDEEDRVYNLDQYAQATWRVAEDWTVMAGVRHSRVNFQSIDGYVTTANPNGSGQVHYSATTPVAGVMFRLSPKAHLYADWGEGFETPTFSELSYRNDGASGLALYLKPARTRSGEVGLKLEPTAQSHAELALFRADSRNELAVATSSGGRTTYQNIDRARRQGVEASFSTRFANAWTTSFSYTWLDATYRSPFVSPHAVVASGSRIPGVPRSHAYASLHYGLETGWQFDLNGSYMDAVPANDLNTVSAPSHALFGLGAGYIAQLGSWRTHVFGRIDNAFDRHYVGSVIVNDGNGRYFEPGPGRTFLLGVDLRWEP